MLAGGLMGVLPPGERLERGTGQPLLYRLAGDRPIPDEALIIGLDRASVGWLRFEAEGLAKGDTGPQAGRLAGCLDQQAIAALRHAYDVEALPRRVHLCLLERLHKAGAAHVVFDILFARQSTVDEALAEAMARHGEVLLLAWIDETDGGGVATLQQPRGALQRASAGSGPFLVDAPEGRLHGWVVRHPTYAEAVALPDLGVGLARGQMPDGRSESRPLRLYGPPGALPRLSLREALATGPGEAAAAARIRGRTVFVGAHAPDVPGRADHYAVAYPGADGRSMPGVEIMATAFLNRLTGDGLTRPPQLARAAIVGGLSGGAAAAALLVPGVGGLVGLAAGGAFWLAIAGLAFAGFLFAGPGLWLPVAVPLVVVLPAALIAALLVRTMFLRRVLELVMPEPAIREWEQTVVPEPQPLRTEVASLLLADLRGSTDLSSRLPTADYAAEGKRYYNLVVERVKARGGIVVEFQGDGVLCLFPESFSGPEHGRLAYEAAGDIRLAAAADGSFAAGLRLSQHSGEVSTGHVGAESQVTYKAFGDAVSLTFAIERFGRGLTDIPDRGDVWLLSAAAVEAADGAAADATSLGPVALPGRPKRVTVFRVQT